MVEEVELDSLVYLRNYQINYRLLQQCVNTVSSYNYSKLEGRTKKKGLEKFYLNGGKLGM